MPAFQSLRKEKWRKQLEVEEREFEQLQATKPWFLQFGIPYRLARKAWLYKLGYICTVLTFTVMILNIPKSNARDKDDELKTEYKIRAIIFVSITVIALFLVQGSDPGYVEVKSSKLETEVELSELQRPAEATNNEAEFLLEDTSSTFSDTSSDDTEFDLEVDPDQDKDAFYSGVPIEDVPMRTKYCRQSGKFVAKYDHFCAIINTTIGEKNHLRFIHFLFWNSILLFEGFINSCSGFHDTKAEASLWIHENLEALLFTFVVGILGISFVGLFFFHCFLILANMTTFEFLRTEKVSYLRDKKFKEFDLPFSHGIYGNIKDCVVQDGMWYIFSDKEWTPIKWEIKPFVRNSDDVYNNIWENKYYSCC